MTVQKMLKLIRAARRECSTSMQDRIITAGGPGSGRHPGVGAMVHSGLDKHLANVGFKRAGPTSVTGVANYAHPDGHVATTLSSGHFQMFQGGHPNDSNFGRVRSGTGTGELKSHLREMGFSK